MPATAQLIKMPGLTSLSPAMVKSERPPVMETMILTPDKVPEWKLPGVQRALKSNDKVLQMAIAMQLEAAQDPEEAYCRIPGIITIGQVGNTRYLVDGQHRIRGAFMRAASELLVAGGVIVKQGLVDLRLMFFESMAELAQEFANLGSVLLPMKADDILRALAESSEHLKRVEEECPYIGYDLTGEHKKTKLLSMSSALRAWYGSGGIVPAGGPPAREIVEKYLNDEQTDQMLGFYHACEEAGWNNNAFRRLWGALNLGVNMWLWRRIVLGQHTQRFHGGQKPMILSREDAILCMRELTDGGYNEWLEGRSLRYQDRMPCYTRVKELYTIGLARIGSENPRFPMADWTAG